MSLPRSMLISSIAFILLSGCSSAPEPVVNTNFVSPQITTMRYTAPQADMIAPSDTHSSGGLTAGPQAFLPSEIDPSPLLINNLMGNKLYLMSKMGNILYEWNLRNQHLGADATILDDGSVLASLKAQNEKNIKTFPGGIGGDVQLWGKNGEILWDLPVTGTDYTQHHDVEMLPNGNILTFVWNKIDKQDAKKVGYKLDVAIYPETIIEMNPKDKSIVWKWDSMDHIIQDVDPSISNYGDVANHPEKIDINYSQSQSGMIMHANGVLYDPKKNLIYVSLYSMSEVWVIDHSTTLSEARLGTGGTYGKGGDLVYRFGNPETYKGSGQRFLYSSHHPNFTDSGTFLIYSNGVGATPKQSAVYELKLPEIFESDIRQTPAPDVLWSYTNQDIYFDKVGGAVRLPNGNTLITEGDGTLWEITPQKEIAWKYIVAAPAMLWRTYAYPDSSPALRSLGVTSGGM